MPEFHSLDDLGRYASEVLPLAISDFIDGGSGTETTLAANRRALDRLAIVPRVLGGRPDPNLTATLAGSEYALPIAVAPMAYQRLAHPDGEWAAAQACAATGIPFITSTLSSVSMERLGTTGCEQWFQLYWLRDDEETFDLVRRAEKAGCRALMVTVDVPVMGRRLRDVRNGFVLPPDVRAANVQDGRSSVAHELRDTGSALIAHTSAAFHPGLTWENLERLRDCTSLPLVIKGVLHPADADRAAAIGVAGVVVSNHGGRQLDGAVPTATALPAVVAAVAGRCQVLVDSGVRSGTDVLRMIALGASGVLIGRPVLWGLAAEGETGVRRVLSILHDELVEAMRLAGCADLAAAGALTTRVVP